MKNRLKALLLPACLTIKRNAPVDDTGKTLAHHLLQDIRVRWALESGETPAGPKETLPGGRAEWRQDVKAWFDDGMICE